MAPAPARRAAVTGLGFACSLGWRRADVVARLRELRHAFARLQFAEFSEAPVTVAAPVPGFDILPVNPREWKYPAEFDLPPEFIRSSAPHGLYALAAVQAALREAGLEIPALGDGRTGLYAASAGSPRVQRHAIAGMERAKGARGEPLAIVRSISGTLNFNLSTWLHIRGPNLGFVSACASSAHALGYALDDLRLGRIDRAVVVGAEDLTAETLLPFAAMRALSINPDPDTACRPFDAGRDGFVGTGGAAVVILESPELAAHRGARPQAWFDGWGQSADGHAISAPDPDGAGLQRAVELALTDAAAPREEIDYVNAHATSTPVGDRAEAKALTALFAAHGLRPAVSSTKALTGHGLSLAGALEAALCTLCLDEGLIPGCAQLVNPDGACAQLHLPRQTEARRPRRVLSNSSGFGGSNVALLFSSAASR